MSAQGEPKEVANRPVPAKLMLMNMAFFWSWLISTVAVFVAAGILPGVKLKGFKTAIVVAAVFAIVHFLIAWLLWIVFAIGTLGIAVLLAFVTRVVIDAIVLKIVDVAMDDLKIDGFGWALGMAVLMSLIGVAGEHLLGVGQ